MLNLTFDETEINTIRCALELARDKYRENAEKCRKDGAGARFERAIYRLADQFDRQVAACETLLERIE